MDFTKTRFPLKYMRYAYVKSYYPKEIQQTSFSYF